MKRFPVRKKIRLPQIVYKQSHAFFITIGTHNKYPWFRLYPDLNNMAIQLIRELAPALKMKIYAWCVMPEHIHILIHGNNLIELVRLFKGKMIPIARKIEPARKLWQRSFYDHVLRKEEALHEIAMYIWENPIRANIVNSPADYQWSGSEEWPNWRNFYGRG
ncbi:MAG: transposase [Desulfobacterales bacterium]|jgi:putative transposase